MGKASKQMYNIDQKQEYLNGETNSFTRERSHGHFKRLSDSELRHGKDIADMNVDELRDSFAALNIRTESFRGQMLSLMRKYVSWAQLKGKAPINNSIFDITPDSFTSSHAIKIQMLRDPQQLEDILDKTYDPTTYRVRYIRDKLIFRLLYAGIDVNDLIHLKKSDFNQDNNIVTDRNGNTFPLNDRIKVDGEEISLWEELSKATHIERVSKNVKIREYAQSELISNEYILRPTIGRKNDDQTLFNLNSLANIIWKACSKYSEIKNTPNLMVSFERINHSGHFYRMYQRELNGEQISLDTMVDVFNMGDLNDKKVLVKAKRFYTNYVDWKIAFGYN